MAEADRIPPKPKALLVNPDNIPEELKTGTRFVNWKWELITNDKKGQKAWTKPPYQPNGQPAKSNDPSTWVTFDEALAAHQNGKFDGIGRCFGPDDPFTAFDVDECRLADGSPTKFAQKLIEGLSSYCEITPSGKGYRIWARGKKPGPRSRDTGKDVEIYDGSSKRYLCLTGHIPNGRHRKIEPRQAEITAAYNDIFGEPNPPPQHQSHKEGDPFEWDGAIAHLPIRPETKDLILNGRPLGYRSEPIMTVLDALVWSNLSDEQIFEVFEYYPIGEKYREKGENRRSWLQPQIEKARASVTDRAMASILSQKEKTRKPEDEPKEQRSNFELVDADDLIINLSPPAFLIDKILELKTMGQLFGHYGDYKTFISCSMACSVATGTPWMGHPVKQGPVVYILGEGHGGIGRRLRAWCMFHNVNRFNAMLKTSRRSAALTVQESAEEVKRSIDQYATKVGAPALIVIDTLNRNFGPGSENSTEDMTKFVFNIDQYVRGDANILIVHHSGHLERNRGRGSSALPAAIDTEYKVTAVRKMLCRLQCTKMKDAEEPTDLNIEMKLVIIGEIDGQSVTSLVPVFQSEGTAGATNDLGGNVGQAYSELENLYRVQRINLENGGYNPIKARVTTEDWKGVCIHSGIYKDQRAFNNMKNRLAEKGVIKVDGLFVYINEIPQVDYG
jgi:hypothetical protein